MREIQTHPPAKRKPYEVVRRLEFFAGGAELLAWIGPERFTYDGREGYTRVFHLYEFATGATLELHGSWWFVESVRRGGRTHDPPFAPNREWFAFESNSADEDEPSEGLVYLEEVVSSEEDSGIQPHLPGPPYGLGGLAFTPHGEHLIAVRNVYNGISGNGGHWAPDVVQFVMDSLEKPPVRYEEKTNPLTHQTYQSPIYDRRWLPVMPLPHRKVATIALSADGKLLAVGGVGADLHVVDLTRKEVLASYPWEGRFLRDGHPVRVGFDPAAQWVVMLANGRLFARHFDAKNGAQWQTKKTLGYVHDFAYHPTGRFLCAVFDDGQARYLDPLTGKVRQAFKWSKKPIPLYSVAFAPDGLTCAAGSENGKVTLWDVG